MAIHCSSNSLRSSFSAPQLFISTFNISQTYNFPFSFHRKLIINWRRPSSTRLSSDHFTLPVVSCTSQEFLLHRLLQQQPKLMPRRCCFFLLIFVSSINNNLLMNRRNWKSCGRANVHLESVGGRSPGKLWTTVFYFTLHCFNYNSQWQAKRSSDSTHPPQFPTCHTHINHFPFQFPIQLTENEMIFRHHHRPPQQFHVPWISSHKQQQSTAITKNILFLQSNSIVCSGLC